MITTEQRDTVIIPDIHGHVDVLDSVIERYGEDTRYVLLGDIVNGPEVKHTLDLVSFMITELGAVALKGNHEWVLHAALDASIKEEREMYRHEVWRRPSGSRFVGYEEGTLDSYNIPPRTPTNHAAMILYERMSSTGHMALIREMPLFLEAPDFIAVHAGLTPRPWFEQQAQLQETEKQLQGDEPCFGVEPEQIFGHYKSEAGAHPRKIALAHSPELLTEIDKPLVTGHAHLSLSALRRVTSNGLRVRLASNIDRGEPLFVWQSWDNQVVAVE